MAIDRPFPPHPFSGKARLIVAASGGPDSMGLLSLLLKNLPQASKRLVVAHVNYGLRGKESRRDEETVRRFCATWGLPFRCLTSRESKKKAAREGKSLQDFAREVRYSFFSRLTRKEKAWGVAVAHHLEDQAETVLDRLLRGAGPRGISGLKRIQALRFDPTRPGIKVWRPLLSFSKREIMDHLRSQGIAWREDRSNRANLYRRNQIRNLVLPFLKRWNPNLPEVLARIGEVTTAEDEFLNGLLTPVGIRLKAKRIGRTFRFQAGTFGKLPLALKRRWARFVAETLQAKARGLSYERVEEILRLWEGKEKGPRDLGYGLSAGKTENQAFLRVEK